MNFRFLSAAAAIALFASTTAHAQHVEYQCVGGKKVAVDYQFGEATASASVKLDGEVRKLGLSGDSDAETTVFARGPYQLRVENKRDIRKAQGMTVFKDEQTIVNGQRTPVSNMLFKDCSPAPAKASAGAAAAPAAASMDANEDEALTAFSTSGEWRAVVKGQRLELEFSNGKVVRTKIDREAREKGIDISGESEGSVITLNITDKACKDSNGNKTSQSAVLTYKGKTYKGCAVDGAEDAPT